MKHIISDDNYSVMDVIAEKDQFCIRNSLKDESGEIKSQEEPVEDKVAKIISALCHCIKTEDEDYHYDRQLDAIDQILSTLFKRNHILLGKRDGLKVYELLGQFLGEL